MSSKAFTTEQQERQGDQPALGSPLPEVAPSRLREDDQSLPRTLGLLGAVLLIFGSMALGMRIYGRPVWLSPGFSLCLIAVGLCGLLYHASFDRDVLFRRLYLMFSLVMLAVGVVLCLIPFPKVMGDQLRFGAPCLLLALLFCQAGLRNEIDQGFRDLLELTFGGAGGLLAIVGLFGGTLYASFLLPIGAIFAILGLLYLAAFIGNRGASEDLAYYAAVAMGILGLVVLLIPLVRAVAVKDGMAYFTAYGVILVGLGLAYAFTGGGLASDSTLLVLLRRELGAMFLSPITYLVLIGFSGVWLIAWWGFIDDLSDPRRNNFEPIVRNYLFSLFPVIMIIIAAPVLTMGLFSEENRSGTMEVLLTAPVSEAAVVLSKFLAAMITYVLVWLPAVMYLLAIPLAGGNPFDYQPLLSFLVAMMVSGAAFVSMGLFFSSLTRNMLVAAVLSITMMLVLTFLYFPAHMLGSSGWTTPLQHMSYLDLYFNSLEGKLTPKYLLFPASLTVLFLFLTLKVLESRKWR